MCVKCRCKALILARKSVQPFIISSHLNSFSFRQLFFSYVPSLLRDRKSVRRIKRSLGWREFVWWVMGWTNFKKRRKIHLPSIILSILKTAAFTSLFILLLTAAWMLCVCTHALCREGRILLSAHNYQVPELAPPPSHFFVKPSILIAITYSSRREATGEQSHFLDFVLCSLLSHNSV